MNKGKNRMKNGMNSNLMKSAKNKVKKLIIKISDYEVISIPRTCHELYSSTSRFTLPAFLGLTRLNGF